VAANTIRVTTENGAASTASSKVLIFCTNPNRDIGAVTFAGDNAFDYHCSTGTLDAITGPISWTFTGADGTAVSTSLPDGASLSVNPSTSSIHANAGSLTLTIGGAAVTLAAGQTAFADATAPITSAAQAPLPNGDGWHDASVSIALAAADNTGGAGVKEIHYALSGAQSGGGIVSGATATVPVSADGVTTLTYFAVDNAGNEETAQTLTLRIDKTPPAIACAATPNLLWPPTHALVPVTVAVTVNDAVSMTTAPIVTAAQSSEPGADQIQGFVVGTPSTSGFLRAERLSQGPGRVYTLTYTTQDQAGNSASCSAVVTVPHDRGKR
jgi:hypothetical protein